MKKLTNDEIRAMSQNTRLSFGKAWYKNAWLNRRNDIQFKEIEGNWHDKEVILVGCSPTLESQIDILKAVDRERFNIVAVDVVFKYLVKNGVIPDCVAVADSKNTDKMIYLEDGEHVCDTKDIMLLVAHTCDPYMIGRWKGPVCQYMTLDAENQWQELRKYSACNNALTSGGNVSSIAMAFITDTMECKRLVMLGMEHSWRNMNKRFAGQEKTSDKRKFNKKKLRQRGKSGKRGLRIVHDFEGNEVFSDEKYTFYASWMDMMVQKHNKNVYDATIGGLFGNRGIKKIDAAAALLQPFELESWDWLAWYDMYTRKHDPDVKEIVAIPKMENGEFAMPEGFEAGGELWTEEHQEAQIVRWERIRDEHAELHPLLMGLSPNMLYEEDHRVQWNGQLFGLPCYVGYLWDVKKMTAWGRERYLNERVELSENH